MDAKTRLSRIQLMRLMNEYPDYADSMGLKMKLVCLDSVQAQHRDSEDFSSTKR